MPLVLCKAEALSIITARLLSRDLQLKLYTNDYVPTKNSLSSDFVELVDANYVYLPLPGVRWSVSDVLGTLTATFLDIHQYLFTTAFAGGAKIYGYFVVDATGVLVFSERATSAYTPLISGVRYNVAPKFSI